MTTSTPHPRRLARPLTALALTGLVAAGSVAAVPLTAQAHQATDAQRASVRLVTTLKPSGDPDGAGSASLTFTRARHQVCATIHWQRIGAPDSAHLHLVSTGQVVVDLSTAVTGGAACTTAVSKAVIGAITAHPGRYYLNVHNATYPAGAIQGTLRRP